MTALDYILVGLERNLELERELGRSRIEIDRSWLDSGCILTQRTQKIAADLFATARRNTACGETTSAAGNSTKSERDIEKGVSGENVMWECGNMGVRKCGSEEVGKSGNEEMVFLHDGKLSAAAMEMMEKIFAATKEKGCEPKLVFAAPVPPARAYILLGKAAESRFASALTGMRKDMIGVSVSPEEFVRFADSPSTKLKKWNLWVDIQRKVQLIKAGRD